MPWHIWLKFGYQTPNHSKNKSTNFTPGHMGQIPVIRCFVQKFYMFAYVTKARLGSEPEFTSLCRSFFRWSRLVIQRQAYLHCLYCLFFRWRSWYCCAGRLTSQSVTRPARPELSLKLDKVFKDTKIWTAVVMICYIIFFRNSHRKDDWIKKIK